MPPRAGRTSGSCVLQTIPELQAARSWLWLPFPRRHCVLQFFEYDARFPEYRKDNYPDGRGPERRLSIAGSSPPEVWNREYCGLRFVALADPPRCRHVRTCARTPCEDRSPSAVPGFRMPTQSYSCSCRRILERSEEHTSEL